MLFGKWSGTEVKIDGQTVRIPRRLVKAAQLGLVDVEQF